MRSISSHAVLLVAAGALSGCGTGPATVSGRVALDGAPVETGQIWFRPAGETAGGVRADVAQGRYEFASASNLKPGKYRVEITTERKTGRKVKVSGLGAPGASPPGDRRGHQPDPAAVQQRVHPQRRPERRLQHGRFRPQVGQEMTPIGAARPRRVAPHTRGPRTAHAPAALPVTPHRSSRFVTPVPPRHRPQE